MFSSSCDKDSATVFTTGRLPDVNYIGLATRPGFARVQC
jgi:hypothetical protein